MTVANETPLDMEALKYDAQGLIPAVVQDATTKQVLALLKKGI